MDEPKRQESAFEVHSEPVPGDDKAYDVSVRHEGKTLKEFRVLTMRNTTKGEPAESER